MFVYIYSSSTEIVSAVSSSEKIRLLPYLVSNCLKDIAHINAEQYNIYIHKKIKSFDDENLQKMLSIIENDSTCNNIHLIQEAQIDRQLPYFDDHMPAPPPRRATPARPTVMRRENPAPPNLDLLFGQVGVDGLVAGQLDDLMAPPVNEDEDEDEDGDEDD